jgi:hypothetical protein
MVAALLRWAVGEVRAVQVKSTMFKDRGGYSCTVRGSSGPYEGDPFEYLAAYVFQERSWYIIPGNGNQASEVITPGDVPD